MVNRRKASLAPLRQPRPAAPTGRPFPPDPSGLELLLDPAAAASGGQAALMTDAVLAPASPLPGARELPQLLTVAEVGEMFGRAPRTIRSWIKKRHLRRVKVGNSVFIPMTEIDALLSSQD